MRLCTTTVAYGRAVEPYESVRVLGPNSTSEANTSSFARHFCLCYTARKRKSQAIDLRIEACLTILNVFSRTFIRLEDISMPSRWSRSRVL